ncbi:uncharacterized protein CIMG_10266 [Coccidioides immitis RS]|uniref:Uncharacterized protein n=4 Tax=Coccidioides TaxID=5500 RepID=J3K158_COCIM|nr:uncharacterized protein CIMG_10266 [Coccidioides immitis RS]EFW19149.1 conserved hypothetical protein [Coccidioides posadasii str. Silveira]KMP09631.1 hypothetical protein CIRG_09801 [Coccidioides immitis RMSCC 2394]KMU90797.1 hypothetical protein CIHG_08601 [Coccidioides immitis H538.4]TPX20409.1 hypothetical protein DIZ76_016297 [Coccidioides immitis]EAS27661.3 hypothetical protein CIMG_10266 [Coccidioides immitis RS]
MQFKSLAFLLLSATALASPEPAQKRDDLDEITSAINDITSAIPTDLSGLKSLSAYIPPPGIASVLATAIPSDVRESIQANPTAALEFNSALYSSLKAGQTPSWYEDLPDDVKSYLNRIARITGSDGPQATGAGEPAQTSDNFAPRATGAIAASVAGAAGLLGLAFAL